MKEWQIEATKKRYPVGTKIELISMNGENQMPSGLKGTVDMVDDIGQVHVDWENGSTLALIPGVDNFKKLPEQEQGMTMGM